MTTTHIPQTYLGRQLLHSIPCKIYLQLKRMADVNKYHSHSIRDIQLSWEFSEDDMCGTVELYVGDEKVLHILWDLDLDDPSGTVSALPLLEPIEEHLSSFIQMEKLISEVLADYFASVAMQKAQQV